jgi:hypothetical protein
LHAHEVLLPFRNRIPRQRKIMHCVIGSGPAGVACARALLARGANVLMLDAGLELEPERAQVVRKLAATKPSEWQPGQIARLKEGMVAGAKGVPLKFVFGSDFPYRETETQTPWQGHGVGIRPSLALGGLSTVCFTAAGRAECSADLSGRSANHPCCQSLATVPKSNFSFTTKIWLRSSSVVPPDKRRRSRAF